MKAVWNETVVAESQDMVVVEGNHYFPRASLREELFSASATRTTCPWKGEAGYLSLDVDGSTNADAAWTYLEPKDAAAEIKDRVAFWKGVQVLDS